MHKGGNEPATPSHHLAHRREGAGEIFYVHEGHFTNGAVEEVRIPPAVGPSDVSDHEVNTERLLPFDRLRFLDKTGRDIDAQDGSTSSRQFSRRSTLTTSNVEEPQATKAFGQSRWRDDSGYARHPGVVPVGDLVVTDLVDSSTLSPH